ncbi:hypothetical protein HII31_02636 [Pseudocercospora fuligena]|uniref:Uncharacterized protein n=1 Tax=Pseudocercospora fuligena TaxID=685502 RepID=A0A8H6VRA0_9PEZI|nr:hypothetical protein HII31_02636 [Pseudocercospora fuligena]
MPTPLDRALNSKVSRRHLSCDVICEATVWSITAFIWTYLFIYFLRVIVMKTNPRASQSYFIFPPSNLRTPITNIYDLQNLFLGFTALVTAATAWSIWGQDMFPKEPDPTGEPETWTNAEMRRWLNNRNLMAGSTATREELLARVKANMRAPRV